MRWLYLIRAAWFLCSSATGVRIDLKITGIQLQTETGDRDHADDNNGDTLLYSGCPKAKTQQLLPISGIGALVRRSSVATVHNSTRRNVCAGVRDARTWRMGDSSHVNIPGSVALPDRSVENKGSLQLCTARSLGSRTRQQHSANLIFAETVFIEGCP